MINKDQRSDKGNDIEKKFINSSDLKNVPHKKNDAPVTETEIINKKKVSENFLNTEKNSSKNLADFFNGQIVDTEQE